MIILILFSSKKIFFKIFGTLDHRPQKYGVLLYVKCKVFINIYKTCDIYLRRFACACVYVCVYTRTYTEKHSFVELWKVSIFLFFSLAGVVMNFALQLGD